ncbi:MAG TPA: VOC family protein [Steroidobacteraceae bacterium]
MHKSRLAGFIIDCQTPELEQAARFWSAALGYPIKAPIKPEDSAYRTLETPAQDVHIEVQQVDHASRVHLDIESDDIEAEVRRLEGLGAKRVRQLRTWWVMEAPSGQRFCVVRPQRAGFEHEANTWVE